MRWRWIPLGVAFLFGETPVRGAEASAAVLTNVNTIPASSEWVMRTWKSKDGLPQNSVNALVQTRDGSLWVATSGGLARFDGERFHVFGLADGLRSVQIQCLHEDPRGTLWVGTAGGSVSRWDNGYFTTFGGEAGFPPANAQALAGDRDASLWVGTERGLMQWRDGKFRSVGSADGIPTKPIRALLLDSRGTLWVSVLLDGLYYRTNGTFTRVQQVRGMPSDAYCLAEDHETNIWAGSGTGRIWRWREGVWTQAHATNGVPNSNIESLAQAGSSPLWIAARERGIGFLDRDGFHDVTASVGFSGESARVITIDREGMIWVGTYSDGLHRISRRWVRSWGTAEALGQRQTTSVTEGPDGMWWVCTPSKGIFQFQNGQFHKLKDPNVSGNTPFIYTSAITDDGSVWAAGEQCLFRFQAGRKTEAFYESPIKGEAIRALCADGTNLWAGTYYSTLLKVEGTNVVTIATNGSFAGGINSIVREAPGVLWIGSSGGLYRWERGAVRSWGTGDGLVTAYIRTLHSDADGTLWIGTLGGGLARLKNGAIASLTTRHGLVDDIISQIAADDFGRLWLGSNRGIMGLERRELDDFFEGKIEAVHPITVGQDDGMLEEQCAGGHSPTVFKTRDGRLLFPTAGGIVEMDPSRMRQFGDSKPQAVIEEVFLDGRLQKPGECLIVPPGTHRVEVAYTAPSLRGGNWVRFRSRLEGLENEWVAGTARRTATFHGLLPGHYTFHVTACDRKGTWNATAASLAIVVQPHFWQTLWFHILFAVGLAGVIFVILRRQMANLAATRRAQEAFTRQLINTQEAERARLARELHDDITQRLARLAIDAGRVERTGGEIGETMRGVREGLVRLSEDVHTLSYRLHSSLLDDLGLAEALKAECERFAKQESVACELKLKQIPDTLSRDAALGLFRVTQEALRNIGRHAKAKSVEITLRPLDDGLQLAICDDGVGFDPGRKRQRISLGLASMRERMRLLGGEADIESTPGHGTSVVAWVPLNGAAENKRFEGPELNH